ncbi:phosphoglucosamine mutase [Polynucleobacter sp. SHI8]|uniref:phosphoglucosamine mutase n=1 Tax=unclassified Polynucleobacter TaxID=2640945 RepID=UPI0024905FC0|nr:MULTISPECIES: phosphoglucosamine mutase [unclassified Polynucleobacter]BDW10602.1 phosphoglucosamine mutase [Polynucleobacter sp. SHI2]BDW13048.1 phosphoglucosamine mutase [Polynucleobacter sp. SHI8]
MNRKYFGTDGIRGEVGIAPITPDFVMRLGYAAGKVFARLGGGHGRATVLIGKDTRISGYMLESALEAGFTAAGVDVVLCGPTPTPGVAYLTRALRLSAGVVISASHNPYQDNGIKFFSADGDKLADVIENQIESMLDEPFVCATSMEMGKVRRLDDAAGRYIEFCKSTFPNQFDLHGLKLVVDCAHGAAYHIAPNVFHELGAEVIAIGNQPNGMNINDGVGATAPQACISEVKASGADYGIALDGDADRLQMVDAQGNLFNGDELLYLVAKDRIESGKEVRGAVGTLMTNFAIEKAFQELGVPFERAAVGDRYVLEKLKQHDWMMGGESSGHLIFLDKHTTGDGIVAALQVLATIRRSGKGIRERLSSVQLFPQVLINVRYKKSFDWKNDHALQEVHNRVMEELGSNGRVLVRASGTEPVLRVMVEAKTHEIAESFAQRIAEKIPVG